MKTALDFSYAIAGDDISNGDVTELFKEYARIQIENDRNRIKLIIASTESENRLIDSLEIKVY